ncbi:MAG: hypothetical protein GF414_04565 [Candidatus Altiarchaeales archaeon]|nr:hypothetical protein [Candidatus Altiarchaeales archaeon]
MEEILKAVAEASEKGSTSLKMWMNGPPSDETLMTLKKRGFGVWWDLYNHVLHVRWDNILPAETLRKLFPPEHSTGWRILRSRILQKAQEGETSASINVNLLHEWEIDKLEKMGYRVTDTPYDCTVSW